MKSDGKTWLFVIDTDEYAGNFERELAAYVTGQCGETHGEDEAALGTREIDIGSYTWFVENIITSSDGEHGMEIGHVYQTSPNQNNSVAIEFSTPVPSEIRTLMVERAQAYKSLPKQYEWVKRPNISDFRLFVQETKTTEIGSGLL